MSNYLAIATVTAALQEVLREGLYGLSPTIRVGRPKAEPSDSARVNLYLYQVTLNPYWRHAELPTRDSQGGPVQKPTAALDLHYLITIYEGENLLAERILGRVVQTLHRQPVLDRNLIQRVTSASGPSSPLASSDLAQAPESIKFTQQPLSLEELSKLWSVFFQTSYSLSLAYVAGPVFIEAEEPPRRALPVREPRVHTSPFHRILLEQALSEDGQPAVVLGGKMVLRGRSLAGPNARVAVGRVEIAAERVSGREARVPLVAPALRAGIQGVRIVHGHGRFDRTESNILPVAIRPRIENVQIVGGNGARKLRLKLSHAVEPAQRIQAFLNEIGGSGRAYVLLALSPSSTTDTVDFPLRDVPAGDYLVRIEVDGAESLLVTDAHGRYTGPKAEVPS